MRRVVLPALVALLVPVAAFAAGERVGLLTASPADTSADIGRDLARSVGPAADVAIDLRTSARSAESVRRLRVEPDAHLAIVHSDVYQAFLDRASTGDAEAAALVRPLRVVLPLYDEEVYFVVRAGSNLRHLHEIRDARINVGPAGSGAASTASTVYRLVFGTSIDPDETFNFETEDALVRLTTDRGVDVVAFVAGQPAKILAGMKPEARQYLHMLAVDPAHPSSEKLRRAYFPATVRASSYPNLLDEDLPAVAVKALLVTTEAGAPEAALVRFARALCRNLPVLRATGHPKWQDVKLDLPPLERGWSYYEPTAREFRACLSGPLADSPAAGPEAVRSR